MNHLRSNKSRGRVKTPGQWADGRLGGWQFYSKAGLGKTERVQIQRADEGVQETRGVFGGDVILQPFGKEQGLGPVQAGAMIHA